MSTWRVATANIRHGLGPDGVVDLVRTARELRALGAEMIGLQEIDVGFGPRSDHVDQAARLGELSGMQGCFGAALDLPPTASGGPRRQYGVALLTEHEILAHEMHPLPAPPEAAPSPSAESRGVLRARLRRRDGQELEVLVTHLDTLGRAHRAAQALGIVELTRGLDRPAVLMGDMNAGPRSPELGALAAAGWREAGAEARGLRRGALPRATFPARFPVRRIDQVWVRGAVTVTGLESGPRGSSDHRPVVAGIRTEG